MKRVAAVLAVLVLGLALPSLATAQLGPTSVPPGLTQPPPDQQPAAPVNDPDSGLSTLQLVLMFGGAAAVIAVIAWLIMRDARGAAPVAGRGRGSSSSVPETPAQAKKSARERERERARKRNKAKAVRDQRKRNRPR